MCCASCLAATITVDIVDWQNVLSLLEILKVEYFQTSMFSVWPWRLMINQVWFGFQTLEIVGFKHALCVVEVCHWDYLLWLFLGLSVWPIPPCLLLECNGDWGTKSMSGGLEFICSPMLSCDGCLISSTWGFLFGSRSYIQWLGFVGSSENSLTDHSQDFQF